MLTKINKGPNSRHNFGFLNTGTSAIWSLAWCPFYVKHPVWERAGLQMDRICLIIPGLGRTSIVFTSHLCNRIEVLRIFTSDFDRTSTTWIMQFSQGQAVPVLAAAAASSSRRSSVGVAVGAAAVAVAEAATVAVLVSAGAALVLVRVLVVQVVLVILVVRAAAGAGEAVEVVVVPAVATADVAAAAVAKAVDNSSSRSHSSSSRSRSRSRSSRSRSCCSSTCKVCVFCCWCRGGVEVCCCCTGGVLLLLVLGELFMLLVLGGVCGPNWSFTHCLGLSGRAQRQKKQQQKTHVRVKCAGNTRHACSNAKRTI